MLFNVYIFESESKRKKAIQKWIAFILINKISECSYMKQLG